MSCRSTLNLKGDASRTSCLVSWLGRFCSLCFPSHWPSSTPQAIFPVVLWCGMCCGGWIGSVRTPSDSSESALRRSVVSQYLCNACSPDVHVAKCTVHVVTPIKAPRQYNACWRRRVTQCTLTDCTSSIAFSSVPPVSGARRFLSRSLRRRSLSSRLCLCSSVPAVFQFLKRVHAYASSHALFHGIACLPASHCGCVVKSSSIKLAGLCTKC